MNTKALRQKVLDLAIHGKLVPQNPNDESATLLLEKIRAEKTEKIKKGELKADKKDSFIFIGSDKRHYEQFADGTLKDIEDEIPFDVPEGWCWCRLTNVAITELGKTLDAKKNKGKLYDYLCALNVKWYSFDFTTLKQIRLEEKEKERYLVRKGDLLICEGGDVGRAAIWESENPIYYQNALHRVRFYQNINQYFFLHVLNYYKNLGIIDDVSGGVTIKHFTQNSMQKLLFPLPPLAEQERIASSIDNIFTQIGMVDQYKSELQTVLRQTKSKILDLAIHGKLVPQNPDDEPAEELLKRIATSDNRPYKKFEDEAPFTIPKSWSWCTLGEICKITSGNTLPKEEEKLKGQYIYIKVGDMNLPENSKEITTSKTFIDNIKYEKQLIEKHSIVFPKRGGALLTNKKRLVIKSPILMDLNLMALTPIIKDVLPYIFNWFSLIDLGSINNGSNIPQINNKDINPLLIPLPPLAEQHRIVSKIEELFSYLDTIASNLE